jgi:hypothetical protein
MVRRTRRRPERTIISPPILARQRFPLVLVVIVVPVGSMRRVVIVVIRVVIRIPAAANSERSQCHGDGGKNSGDLFLHEVCSFG